MLTPTYDPVLVGLSIGVAMLASFAALIFASQVTSLSGAPRLGWLAGGASVMGLGIWSMHFVGMLAFHLPVAIHYNLPLMLLSVGVAIAASLLALMVVSRPEMSVATLLMAGLLMGAAIAGMHYIGMASMHAAASLRYDVPLVVASLVIAVVASIAALWLAYRFRSEVSRKATRHKALAAIVMGIAIAGMHYTGMAAASFAPADAHGMPGSNVLATDQLGWTIAAGSLIMIAFSLVGLLIDRRVLQARVALTDQLQAQALLLGDHKEELEAQTENLAEQAVEQEMLNDELLLVNERLQEALLTAERASKAEHDANVARTRFVNMASHELRTPLGAIGGYTELLLMGLRGPLNEAQASDMRRIQVNQMHLLRLINEMLELAKLEAGQLPLQLEECELCEILRATYPMIEPQLLEKNITYSLEVDDSLPKLVGDAEKLQQILINLLANSIKFTPASGTIRVSGRSSLQGVEIRVSDSGPGVPAEKVASLFTPFLQLADAQHSKAIGTGLGLAISRELARAMGGELDVDPEARPGATFVLSLATTELSPLIAEAV